MNEYMSTVIIALITGIFSIVTLVIQKRQDKVISKIDEQTSFMEKEKDLKKKLDTAEKEKQNIIHDIMIMTLDTNMYILKNASTLDTQDVIDECIKRSEELKNRYAKVVETIDDIGKQYDMILDMTSQFMHELEKMKNSK